MLPEAEVEKIVVEEWCAILETSDHHLDDEFFVLGGNSLLAVEFVEKVERRLGFTFPFEALFVEGTLGSVIEACRSVHTEAHR